MYDRPFGVEIECATNGRGRYGTIELMRAHGFHNWTSVAYDGSEIEIRGPILKGAEGMKELKAVMTLLNDKGYYTTESDGMHVHFDAHDLNESDMIRVIRSWSNNQHIIEEFLGDRFHNGFCSPISGDENWLDEPQGLWYMDGQKCYAIEPRSRLRTLEFRQHFGTIEFEQAQAWILLVQAFIKNVKQRKNPMKKVSMEELFRLTRVYKVAQKNLMQRVNDELLAGSY